VVAQHHDKDLSGERGDNRPGLQRAITAACDRKAVLCVYSLSRLARCTKDAIDLAERLSAAGADLAVIQENVNTRSPMGRFVFILFSALAELEHEQVAERTSTAMLRHQAKGRRMTRPDRCPLPDEDVGPVIAAPQGLHLHPQQVGPTDDRNKGHGVELTTETCSLGRGAGNVTPTSRLQESRGYQGP
jgi:DNA invertase Pin-like site-specific DNA recombinase